MEPFIGDKLSHVMAALAISKDVNKDVNLRLNGLKSLYKNISVTAQYLKHSTVTEDLKNIVIELESKNDNENTWQYFQMKRYAFCCLEKVSADCSDEFFEIYYLYLKKQIKLNLHQQHKTNNWYSFMFYLQKCIKKRQSSNSNELRRKNVWDAVIVFLTKCFYILLYAIKPIDQPNKSEATNISGINILDSYMNTCDKTEKFRMLKNLSIYIFENTCEINLSIFKEFQSKDWGKELLTYILLSNNMDWNVTETPKLVREINSLDIFLQENNRSYCIEDVLELLITTQKSCEMNIGFIIKILTLLHSNESLDLIFEDFCFLPKILSHLELICFKEKCNEHRIIYSNENEIKELQYLLFYSEEIIDVILSKVKPETPITSLIDFFKTVNQKKISRKEDFLLKLTPNGAIEDWKGELSLTSIETFICEEFPAWEYKTASDIIRDFSEIYFLPVNIDDNKNRTTYCQFKNADKSKLREAMHLGNKKLLLHKLLYDLNNTLFKLMLKCKFSESTLENVKRLIQCLDTENKIIQLINALEILIEYDINISQSDAMEIIFNSTEINVQENIHSFIIECSFPGTYEKSVDQLIDQLVTVNRKENTEFLKNRKELLAEYNKVINAYNSKSVLFEEEGLIKDWDDDTILSWSLMVRMCVMKKKNKASQNFVHEFMASLLLNQSNLWNELSDEVADSINNKVSKHEKIAIIKRGMELKMKHKVRDIQILSVILFLNCLDDKGRLAQINTGEGKSIIIAMIAAYHGLQGHQVDIITSSKLLAIPQSEEFKKFYSIFSLVVFHNFFSNKAYRADIVYGTSIEFQGDILRDEFRKTGCRHGRKCDIAIVDEVDNMLVDGNRYIVFLSCQMPAMDHLETILSTIYAQVKAAASSIVVHDGQCYFIECETVFDENGQRKDEYIENHIPIEGTMRDFIKKSTELHVRKLIRDCDPKEVSSDFPEIKIPKHLREFICKTQLKNWIEYAIRAKFDYAIKKDYILVDNEIKIVDADNTGVVQQNMHWSDGMHQFIEIKHGTNINPENLTSNFISNVTFFRRYRPKIYGLSGTLGCQGTKELLAKTYNLDFAVVPPFKLKQHKEISSIIVNNRNDWYNEIVKSSLRKLCNKRAVLIITEYINETEMVEKTFVDVFGYDKKKIKLYKTNNDSTVVNEPLESGHVLITTNIAGRGTDIKLTKNVDKNGGLHVCITFLPKNSRVEEQNVGRTSRTGNRGTSQFILCNSETDVEKLRKNRYEKEQETLKNAEKEIENVTAKDDVFQKFCQLMDLIKGRNAYVKEIEKQAVEERFAIWLKMHDDEITDSSKSDFFKSFESFREEILRDDRNEELIKNPYMFVLIGNEYLNDKKYVNAISEYTSAIEMDPNFAEHAHYNRGYAYIAEYGGDATKNRYFIDKAIDDLKKSRKLIEEKEYSLHLMQHAAEGEVFSKQISNKLNLYNIQKGVIDNAIGPDVTAINSKIEEYEKLKKRSETTSEDLEKISEAINNLKTEKDKVGVIPKALSNERDMKIEIIKIEECLFENDGSHDNEIKFFKGNGAIGGFQISEIPPIDWVSVVGLLLLGFGQVIAGAALTVFTLGGGASFGMGLITEGIGDIITAVKDGIINRDFSWARWAIEKAISLVVSVACAGWKAIKDVAKTAYAGVKTAASIGKKVVTETVKEGWKIVAKKVGFELSKGVAKELASNLANYGVSQTIIPLIQQQIIEKVQGPIEEALKSNASVEIMLKLDQIRNNQHYENHIMKIGMELLKPGSSRDIFDLVGIAQKIGNRIADNLIPGLSVARQVSDALNAVAELSTLTDKFINKITETLDKEAKKDKLEQELEKASKPKDEDQEKSENQSVQSAPQKNVEGDIDLNLLHEKDEQAKLQRSYKGVEGMSKKFINVISTTMVNTIQQKLVSPIVQSSINYSIDSMTSNVNKSLNEHVETYRSHKRIIHQQNKGFNNAKTNKEINNVEESRKILKVDELIDDVRSGGPSGLVHLGAVSDAIDRPIEVYDKKGKLKYVIGDTKKGVPTKIQYHDPKNGENIGHYTLLGNKEPSKNSGHQNMCIYNVLGEQTGHDPDELKKSSLKIMENNKKSMAKQVDDINRLEMYSKLRLAVGGATYKGKNPDDAAKILRDSTGAKGYKFKNPGHPLNHVPVKGKTDEKLEAASQHLKKKIIVYDENGDVLYSKGENFEGEPIKLKYSKLSDDTLGEWSSKDGNGPSYKEHDYNDADFYKLIGNQHNEINKKQNEKSNMTNKKTHVIPECKSEDLMSAVNKKINETPVDKSTFCVENYSSGGTKTGFLSEVDMNYVTHNALILEAAKKKMNELNTEKNLTPKTARKTLIIPVEDLGLSRTIYAQEWIDGRPSGQIKPAKSIVILLQHHEGQEKNPDADVHIQTVYPRL